MNKYSSKKGCCKKGVSGSERETIDEELTLDPKIQREIEQIMEKIYRKVQQRLEKRPKKTFMKTMPLIRKAKLVGNGIAVKAPKGYKSRGHYPAGLNEQNCPNFPFCRWVP